MKALGRGFSAAPFNTFTIRFRPGTCKGEKQLSKDSDNKVVNMPWKYESFSANKNAFIG